MNLDEAIKHAEEKADESFREWEKTDKQSYFDCYMEYTQLVEWLKDYKRLLAKEIDNDR